MSNSDKLAAAAAKRKENRSKLRKASTTSGWLKDSVRKKGHPIIKSLQDYYVSATAERNRYRDTEHIHPSEMAKADWCPRQTGYRISGADPDPDFEPEKLYWRLASIFEEGHGIHEKHQDAFWEMGVLYGMWECAACELQWWDVSPAVCASCASVHIEYKEVPLSHPEFHIIGHTDGIHLDNGVMTNLEIKSVGIRSVEMELPGVYRQWKENGTAMSALWSAIKVPFPSHRRQVQIYMACLRAMGFDVSETFFVYEFKADQEMKGFTVKYNEKAAMKILAQAAEVLEHRDDPSGINRPDGLTSRSKQCKDCPYYERCWKR